MSYRYYTGVNRTVCEVLEEIRSCDKTKNYSPLLGLVEEVQSLVNRMEASLRDVNDLEHLADEKRKLKKKLKKLSKKTESTEE